MKKLFAEYRPGSSGVVMITDDDGRYYNLLEAKRLHHDKEVSPGNTEFKMLARYDLSTTILKG